MRYNTLVKSQIYFIKTFGCQMNEADSQRLAAALTGQGHRLTSQIDQATVVVINTCSVREAAENRVFGLVEKLAKLSAKSYQPKVILTGCMVGSARGKRRRYTLTQLKNRLPQVKEFKTISELVGDYPLPVTRPCPAEVLVPIMEGCNHFCTYCVVPYARGAEVSRPLDALVTEVEALVKQGAKAVTLLGQNVNSYQPDFAALLRRLQTINRLQKIAFLTSNPWDLTDEIIAAMRGPKVDRQLHLPVQSGDDVILKKMNRPYTAAAYRQLVAKIRRAIPEIRLSTDIIVGFPGETRAQFARTVALCRQVGFNQAYIARYSPRPGTAAFRLADDVTPAEKKRRWQVLEALINRGKI
ncbi:tRNA (N6-isopentenyl adenosine(37)-C2)-methylthiotransferase MiaB [Candidatus Shapirobacteria bacterium CG10_big_fil_rev_8_21_14_0_10_48_15]|uniref:tRNA-2-methylthio-N(6)-dimethylallyladenosine synthase n=1 Tax=Candidatus Shapirobacteria bacterium CG10_big_fil_rev_8_21_14_0_10_48_15 TaxID=1974484 RepID=A0A2M8L6S5_9BACT|nr:MAG: tRNA (N6-isopentenyl adenosine(37)-C2)-methylthiotransferase MiaB [Candidatus Shapirobacteria bacterium CG10_big_fil_rev_8_21_14_0_10_48_15]